MPSLTINFNGLAEECEPPCPATARYLPTEYLRYPSESWQATRKSRLADRCAPICLPKPRPPLLPWLLARKSHIALYFTHIIPVSLLADPVFPHYYKPGTCPPITPSLLGKASWAYLYTLYLTVYPPSTVTAQLSAYNGRRSRKVSRLRDVQKP